MDTLNRITEPRRFAYATLITRASYLAGVVVLGYTLRKHGTEYPLVVMCTQDLAIDALDALSFEAPRLNLHIVRCEFLLPPKDVKITLIAKRFEDTWTKLRAFQLFEYDFVCYLDADVALFKNPDMIFDRVSNLPVGWIGANHSCVCNRDSDPWAPDDWRPENCAYTPVTHPEALCSPVQPCQNSPQTHRLLNGGLFVFRPSRDIWQDMMLFFNTTPLLSSFKFPDQDFLAHFFNGRWQAIGWQFNALKTMRYWHGNMWRDEEVVCLHYIVDKPWAARIAADGSAGYKGRDGVTHRWWWDAYEKWERDRIADEDHRVRVVSVVRKWIAAPQGGWLDGTYDPVNDSDMAAIGSAVQAFANNRVAAGV